MHRCFSLIILAVLAVGPVARAENETVYFFVGKILGWEDGYVLPLTDPADIEHARELVARTATSGFIVNALVGPHGKGININRNYCDPSVPSWSWYVTEFLGFSDIGWEGCDGTPTAWEQGLCCGQICFWTYTVVQELGTDLDPWCYVLESDCAVDYNDLEVIACNWLGSECEYPGWCGGADLDVSGEVDFIDVAILAEEWLLRN